MLRVGGAVDLKLLAIRPLKPLKDYGLQRFQAQRLSRSEATEVRLATSASQAVQLGLYMGANARVIVSLQVMRPPPPLLEKGWAIRPPVERSNFTAEQKALLTEIFERPDRISEVAAETEFKNKFCSRKDGPFATKYRLNKVQIKSWMSSEKARRAKQQLGALAGAEMDAAAAQNGGANAGAAAAGDGRGRGRGRGRGGARAGRSGGGKGGRGRGRAGPAEAAGAAQQQGESDESESEESDEQGVAAGAGLEATGEGVLEGTYQVEELVAVRTTKKDGRMYLVKWEGWAAKVGLSRSNPALPAVNRSVLCLIPALAAQYVGASVSLASSADQRV